MPLNVFMCKQLNEGVGKKKGVWAVVVVVYGWRRRRQAAAVVCVCAGVCVLMVVVRLDVVTHMLTMPMPALPAAVILMFAKMKSWKSPTVSDPHCSALQPLEPTTLSVTLTSKESSTWSMETARAQSGSGVGSKARPGRGATWD